MFAECVESTTAKQSRYMALLQSKLAELRNQSFAVVTSSPVIRHGDYGRQGHKFVGARLVGIYTLKLKS